MRGFLENYQRAVVQLPSLMIFLNISSPEYNSIKKRNKKRKREDRQVHDESNRTPNWTFYVQPTGSNTSIEIAQLVSGKCRIKILVSFSRRENNVNDFSSSTFLM